MSDLGVTIFLLVCCYPVLPIMAAVMANEAKVKKNIAIGCTLPLTAQHDPRVQEICREYKKRVWRWFFIMTAALIPALLLPRFSLALAYMFIWMLAAMAPSFVLFARYNGRLRALKKENGWLSPYGGTVVAADLGAKPEELGKPLSRWLFIPPLLVSLIPCALAMASGNEGERMGGLILGLTFALCCLMSLFFYPLVFRQRPDVVDSDSRVNAALTRVRRYNWGKTWIAMSWLSALLALGFWFLRESVFWLMLLTLAYTAGMLYFALRAEFAVRRAQVRERKVFFDRHARRGAAQGVLKETPDAAGALVLGHEGDVLARERNAALVGIKAARDGVEERRLARSVWPDEAIDLAFF